MKIIAKTLNIKNIINKNFVFSTRDKKVKLIQKSLNSKKHSLVSKIN